MLYWPTSNVCGMRIDCGLQTEPFPSLLHESMSNIQQCLGSELQSNELLFIGSEKFLTMPYQIIILREL